MTVGELKSKLTALPDDIVVTARSETYRDAPGKWDRPFYSLAEVFVPENSTWIELTMEPASADPRFSFAK